MFSTTSFHYQLVTDIFMTNNFKVKRKCSQRVNMTASGELWTAELLLVKYRIIISKWALAFKAEWKNNLIELCRQIFLLILKVIFWWESCVWKHRTVKLKQETCLHFNNWCFEREEKSLKSENCWEEPWHSPLANLRTCQSLWP